MMDKKEILNNFTQDNQDSIRFIESKTAILSAIIGAILIYYLQGIENFVKYYRKFSCLNLFLFYLLVLIALISIYYFIKVVLPLNNPKSKLPANYQDYPNLYLSRENLKKDNSNLKEYLKVFSSEKNTENAIELEYLKTSFIRNEKLYNFKILFILTIILVVIFIIHVIILQNEFINLIPIKDVS